ncbi:chlorophyll synthesis pathway protein BchC [Elioraea sp.]|uniref:chlorophyll synthesis pathway protein BchC n=1 Tax=Elioraea sp. TaxID=2185103 RepID=UPI0025C0060B|nr:chlorophyll synthesis pathway protein BchC [Elioraea sp.]
MDTLAVLLKAPESLALSRLPLVEPGDADVIVDIEWSGISTGTERLLYTGRMPPFPGMGYPLVPGYESVGRVVAAGPAAGRAVGARVFVPGARCFGDVRGLFGGAAARLVVPGAKARPIAEDLGERGVLLALAATAHHAISPGSALPDLIVGHGVLGRLIARLAVALGGSPTVWETNPARADGAAGYAVIDPIADDRRDYRCIQDVSGDATILDTLIARLGPGGEIVLAGFYDRLSFAFPPAFMREARIRIAAEFREADIEAVTALIADGRLSLDGLITHHQPATEADQAYRTAFGDPACLKMILDWRTCS